MAYTRTRRQMVRLLTVVVTVGLLMILLIYQLDGHIFLSHSENDPLSYSTLLMNITMPASSSLEPLSENVVYSLDAECSLNPDDYSTIKRAHSFDKIYETGFWGTEQSRSGEGSSLEGAFDWIGHLRSLFKYLDIQSIADIPCGDTFWQFSVQEINTIKHLYFGGDISSYVIKRNRRLYASHRNKLFRKWDLVRCPIPTFTLKNSTHERKGKQL